MTILLAVAAGGSLGFVLNRGDFCFHRTWRRLFHSPAETSLLRAYFVLLLVSTPIVQLLIATDVINPFIPGFAPWAAIVGGLMFGVGMVIAQTCISGMFYKLGGGMLAMVAALAAWAFGDIITWRGPLKGLRDSLNSNEITVSAEDGSEGVATVTSLFGPFGVVLVLVVGLALAVWVARDEAAADASDDALPGRGSKLGGVRLGLAAAAVMTVAWLLVRWHGFDYTYGTSSVPSQLWDRVVNGADISWWIPVALVSLVPGAIVAAVVGKTLWVRGEDPRRYVELVCGGFVMGIGAGIAGGCNLGHSMVGVPLLSLGSIVTTVAIAAGVFAADRAVRVLRSSSPTLATSPADEAEVGGSSSDVRD